MDPGEITPSITTSEEQKPAEKRGVQAVLDLWFDPRSFENEELYESLGVKRFKQLMPISGDKIYQLWRKFGAKSLIKVGDKNSYRDWEYNTKVAETIHTTGFMVYNALILDAVAQGHLDWAVVIGMVNTLFNIYPIMVQRYNRLRLGKILAKLERTPS